MGTFEIIFLTIFGLFFLYIVFNLLKKPKITKYPTPKPTPTIINIQTGKCYSVKNNSKQELVFEYLHPVGEFLFEYILPGETKWVCSVNVPNGLGLIVNQCVSDPICTGDDICFGCKGGDAIEF